MAVHRLNIRRICCNINRTVYLQTTNLKQSSSNKSTPVDIEDALDNFTNELMQKKKDLWDMRNEKLNSMKRLMKHKHFNYKLDVRNLSEEKLYEAFNCALVECNDKAVIELLKECLKFGISPFQDSILQVLSICAQNGEIDLISHLEKLCKDKEIHLPTNFSFEIYKARAVWMRGNVIKGLDHFLELYKTNPFLRRPVSMTLKQLVSLGIKNNGEAVLIHFLKVAKYFIEQHKDYFFLLCIWEYCFTSEWYSDQQVALDILIENNKLAEFLNYRLPFLLITTLKNHRTEIVYKLLQCFHNLRMDEHCTIVVMALLDYHFFQANIGNYSEIIKWCQQSDISLPSIYNRKYLNLLLKTDRHTGAKNKPKVIKKNEDFMF